MSSSQEYRGSVLDTGPEHNLPGFGIVVERPDGAENSEEVVVLTTPALQMQRTEALEQAPAYEGASFSWGSYFGAVGMLLGMLVLLWFGLRMVRRLGKGRFLPPAASLGRDKLYLEGQLPLGQNKSVAVIRCLDTRLVLGVTDQQISLLSSNRVDENDIPEDFKSILDKEQA